MADLVSTNKVRRAIDLVRWPACVALLVVLWFFLISRLPPDPTLEARQQPRAVAFYRDEPPCADKRVGYVVLAGDRTQELHRVYVCGMGYRK